MSSKQGNMSVYLETKATFEILGLLLMSLRLKEQMLQLLDRILRYIASI